MIELRDVGKRYRKLEERGTLLGSVLPFRRPASRELWALRHLDVDVAPGEVVGVLGHNGAGKTTLLRLLAGVTTPTEGSVRVVGRIAPLISLGVGFESELSGRENVMINGMLLGLSARQVQQRFDSIVDFAELWDFIDTPVKFYSSGMTLRLGFAVVAHVEPTILLVDEILAVGDADFQLKCFAQLRALQREGAAILVVSHSMYQIRQLCTRAILIRRGRLEYDGRVETAIARHEKLVEDDLEASAAGLAAELVQWELLRPGGERIDQAPERRVRVAYDEPLELRARLRFHRPVEDPQIVVGVLTAGGQFGGFDVTRPGSWRTFTPGEEAWVSVTFPVRLPGGRYDLVLDVKDRDGRRVLARLAGIGFDVAGRNGVTGLADVAARVAADRP